MSSKSKLIPLQRESVLLIGFWMVCRLSTILGMAPDRALPQLVIVSKMLLMAFLLTSLFTTEAQLQLLVKVIALGLGLHAVKAGFFVLRTGGVAPIEGPPNTFLEANNTLGMALAVNVPLLFYLSKIEANFWLRWAMRSMVAFSYPAVAGTFARGDWLALALMTGVMMLKAKRKLLTYPAILIFVLVAAGSITQLVSKQMVQRYDTLENYDEDTSAQSRFWNWEFCKRVGMARPLGGGFNLYSFEAYAQYYPEFLQAWPGKIWSCHNTFLSVFAEHGPPGLLLWVSLLVSSLMSLRQVRYYVGRRKEMSWVVSYVDMLQVSLIGFLAAGMFVDFPYYEVFYQLIAVVVILKQVVQRSLVPAVASTDRAAALHGRRVVTVVRGNTRPQV
jgi:probable O-glycosylation ligase (exosortase A-associated)